MVMRQRFTNKYIYCHDATISLGRKADKLCQMGKVNSGTIPGTRVKEQGDVMPAREMDHQLQH